MFEDQKPNTATDKPSKRRYSLPDTRLMLVIIGVLTIAVLLLGVKLITASALRIPPDIAKQVTYPIFTPKDLPDGYTFVKESFTYSEGTLIFRAEDSAGSAIAFTEQKRPKDFDFERFYQGQMENAKTLSNVPHPSVVGKAPTGDLLLSIVTEETWILASSGAPLSDDALQKMAASLKKY